MSAETRHIVSVMRRTARARRETGLISGWKTTLADWAQMNLTDPHAVAVNTWLPLWQARPFYTAEELAPMWPALAIASGFTTRWPAVLKSAKRLEHELDFYGLPRLSCRREYFICERVGYWQRASETEIMQEFENAQR